MAKKKKRMGNIYGIVFLIISVFLIYTLIAKVQHIQAEKATYQKLVVQENELKKEKAKLAKEVDSLNDSDYVVRYARSHYIFSKNAKTNFIKIRCSDFCIRVSPIRVPKQIKIFP